jgi:hypothetical protein
MPDETLPLELDHNSLRLRKRDRIRRALCVEDQIASDGDLVAHTPSVVSPKPAAALPAADDRYLENELEAAGS